MVSRREMLIGGIMTAMQGSSGRNGVARAAAPQPRTKVNFDVLHSFPTRRSSDLKSVV